MTVKRTKQCFLSSCHLSFWDFSDFPLFIVLLLVVCCVIKVAIDLTERNKDETNFLLPYFFFTVLMTFFFFTVHVFLRQRKKVQVCVSVKNKTNKLYFIFYFILHTSLTKELPWSKLTRLSCWLVSCFSCSGV